MRRNDRELAGSDVLGDLGSHIIDMMRFLVGEPATISGAGATFINERLLERDPSRTGRVTVDDAFQALVEFEGGATFEDGYRAAVIADAILASAESGVKVRVEYE